MSEILLRAMIAAAVCALGFGLFRVGSLFVLRKARRGVARFALPRPGVPGIVSFTTRSCVTCKAAQRPALSALEERLGADVQIVEVDAEERPELAREWRVLSVPTTFVLDRAGTPRQVNHGFASTQKLMSQLGSVTDTQG